MAITYVQIASVTVGAGGASAMDFPNIPQTYTDLVLKFSGRTDRANNSSDIYLQFNSSTAANYSFRRIYGTGGGTGASDSLSNNSTGGFAGFAVGATATASTFSNSEIYIPNYTSSSAKSWSVDSVNENNNSASNVELIAGLWSLTSAITSISLKDYNGANFVTNSTATLYGILKA